MNFLRKSTQKAIASITVLTMVCYPFPAMAAATVTPESIAVSPGSAICSGGSQDLPVSITLPPTAVTDKVDVFFSFDDTGSFAGFVPTVSAIFSGLVGSLETTLPGVEFGFGVGRFEDYGGPGSSFSFEDEDGRPFTLNQPIVTAATAGSAATRNTLIDDALSRTAPGFGGDGPETAVAEGLYQIATGAGFDGNGNGSSLDSGNAGDPTTQTNPGTSGDVPPFSSNVAPTSGTQGGVGWRSDALHLAIVATDICPVSAFPAGLPVPATINGAGGLSEPASVFACSSTTPGASRFGFVSDSKDAGTNTVAGAIAPAGAGTVQATVDALNTLGVRVIGMGPSAAPTSDTSPSFDPSTFLSGLARLTGALDADGNPLVFSTSVPLETLSAAIAEAITTTATKPVDIEVTTSALPAGLSVTPNPAVVAGVGPGGTANFVLTLTGSGAPISGSFDVQFKDKNSGALLGTIPATVDCAATADTTPPTCTVGKAVHGVVTVTAQDGGSGLAAITATSLSNAKLTTPPFTPGTTDPVVSLVRQLWHKKSATAQISVSDQSGNMTACDPVSIVVVPKPGKPGEHCRGGIHHDKHHVKITHLDPGVWKIEVEVDGKKFCFKKLKVGEMIDISSAYKSKTDNSVKIKVFGAKGAGASVIVTD